MIRTFTAAEVSSVYRVPLGTVYRLASTEKWRRSDDGKWPVLYNGDDVEATMERRTQGEPDRRAIACNYLEATSEVARGALAYVRWPNWGNDNDRVPLLVRSRGGRWIEKWEAMHRLGNFRIKTIPPEHPRYDAMVYQPDERDLALIRQACRRHRRSDSPGAAT